MPKWRVTFEVDLKDSIPEQEELKPHDYPLRVWAGQTVHDLVLNHALCSALEQKMDALCEDDAQRKKARILFSEAKVDVCRQARDSMQIELIEEVNVSSKKTETKKRKRRYTTRDRLKAKRRRDKKRDAEKKAKKRAEKASKN